MSSKNSLSLSYFLTPFLLILFVLVKGSCLISIMFILILVSLNDNLLSQSFYCFYHYTYMYVALIIYWVISSHLISLKWLFSLTQCQSFYVLVTKHDIAKAAAICRLRERV